MMLVRLRRASLSQDGVYDGADMGIVYDCRNSETARKYSHDSKPITWDHHAAWFKQRIEFSPESIWIGDVGGMSIGYVRQDERDGNRMLISVAVLPAFRGKGYGVQLIKAITSKIISSGRIPTAHVRVENTVSSKAFLSAGFALEQPRPKGVGADTWVYSIRTNGRRSPVEPSFSTPVEPAVWWRRGVIGRVLRRFLGAE